MKRSIYKELVEWKESRDRKPLMLYGARQVGKTYILKEFGNNEFENLVYVNCYKNETVAQLFSSTINVNDLLLGLSAISHEKILPERTLIFIDEAQEIPDVVASLKYFCEDAPEYCVAVAGSLLGVLDMRGISFPVGKVNMLDMYPMTFMEFLDAMDMGMAKELLYKEDLSVANTLSIKYIELLRQYYFVGGMPEAVADFVKNKNPESVRRIQNEILNSYYADMAKHAGLYTQRCRMVIQAIPSMLARENKKFVYGAVKKGARASDFEIAIQWLVDARLIYKVHRVSKVEMPLAFYADSDAFKLFLLDVGLLGALADVDPALILIENKIFSEYKGAFTENYVASQLATVISPKSLYYHTRNNSRIEIDFVVQQESRLLPIEVKAEENVRSKSLRQFITVDNADKDMKGVRFSMKGYVDQDWMENIPLYAIIPYFSHIRHLDKWG